MPSSRSGAAPTLDHLYSLTTRGIRLGLDRVRKFLKALGRPDKAFDSIHIAGTNGKGTTAHLIYAAAREAGISTGLYTSPHLLRFNERIVVDGRPVPDNFLVNFVRRHRPYFSRHRLTFFEITTAMAFEYFREKKVALAVVETGLGGRLDATNVLFPKVSVICDIARDHEQFLGKTIEKIAAEKAGIIKPGIPVVFGVKDPRARRVILRRAPGALNAFKTCPAGRLWLSPTGSRFEIPGRGQPLKLEIPLAGAHQVGNAQIAIAALRTAFPEMTGALIRRAFGKVRIPGRLQWIPGKPPVLLDVCHNPAGVAALAVHLKRFFPRRRKAIVFGVMADKAYGPMIRSLEPLANPLILTRPETKRGATLENLSRWAKKAEGIAPVAKAVARAKKSAGKTGLVVVAGSFYTAAEALREIARRGGSRSAPRRPIS